MNNTLTLRHGDSLHLLETLPACSVGAVVCDPPYDLLMGNPHPNNTPMKARGFMATTWDATGIAFSIEFWTAVLRVLRPGGVVKAFSATRTYHRMVRAMEAAGFVDLQLFAWGYGSGFPKSKCVPLFIDKMAGATGNRGRAIPVAHHLQPDGRKLLVNKVDAYVPITPEAVRWDGWGTGIKPSWEPVIVGVKPV